MPRRFLALLAVTAALLISGCNRSKITTEIKADGTWVRTIAFTGQASQPGGESGGMSMSPMGPKIEEAFKIPAGWQMKEEKKKSDRIVTASKIFRPGAISKGDLTIRESAQADSVVNEVTVKQIAPGKFEYRETLHWTGKKLKSTSLNAKEAAEIKAVLPADLATDANVKALAEKVRDQAYPILFGPGDPLLSIGFMHPDLAEKRITQRLGTIMMQALTQQFGDKLTPDQRKQIAIKAIQTSFNSTMQSDRLKPDAPGGGGPPSDNDGEKSDGDKQKGSLVPLLFIAKLPGKIVETNGEVDELTGEVFWAMFGEAAAARDIILTATCEIQK